MYGMEREAKRERGCGEMVCMYQLRKWGGHSGKEDGSKKSEGQERSLPMIWFTVKGWMDGSSLLPELGAAAGKGFAPRRVVKLLHPLVLGEFVLPTRETPASTAAAQRGLIVGTILCLAAQKFHCLQQGLGKCTKVCLWEHDPGAV